MFMFLKQRRAPSALNIACSDNFFHTAFDVQCFRRFATPTSLRKSFEEMADLLKFNHVNFEKKRKRHFLIQLSCVGYMELLVFALLWHSHVSIHRDKDNNNALETALRTTAKRRRPIKTNYSHSLILYTNVFKIYNYERANRFEMNPQETRVQPIWRLCHEIRDAISRSSYRFSLTYESHEKRLNNRSEQEVTICAVGFFRNKYEEITNQTVVFNWITQLCGGCLMAFFAFRCRYSRSVT